MDAVKAASEIDHSDSIAHDTAYQIEYDPDQVLLTNSVTFMDGVFTPEFVEGLDSEIVSDSDREALMEEVEGGVLTAENLSFLDEATLEELHDYSPEHTLTEAQLETIIRVNARVREVEDEYALVDHADTDYPGIASCSVAAVCVAVISFAIYNTVAAVHTAAAAVAVETYVTVS